RDLRGACHGNRIEVNCRDRTAAMVTDGVGEPACPTTDIEHARLGAHQRPENRIGETRILAPNGFNSACDGFAKVERQRLVKRQHFGIGKAHDLSLRAWGSPKRIHFVRNAMLPFGRSLVVCSVRSWRWGVKASEAAQQ